MSEVRPVYWLDTSRGAYNFHSVGDAYSTYSQCLDVLLDSERTMIEGVYLFFGVCNLYPRCLARFISLVS